MQFGVFYEHQLPRPWAAQPNLNRADTTPIPTEYKASERLHTGTLGGR